jgi:restriction system protein
MRKKKDFIDDIFEILNPIFIFYVLYLLALWLTNRQEFWRAALFGLGVGVIIFSVIFLVIRFIKKRKEKLVRDVSGLNLDKDINSFVNISGKDRSKGVWRYMDYGFNQDKLRIFSKTLIEKGLKVRDIEDLKFILRRFIDKKEEALIKGGFELRQRNFSLLNGADFENLLVKLCETMGYLVEHIGGVGDQGADLILTKDGQRTLIQAKCYKNWGVGNSAVQQAAAAKIHYACSKATVIGIPYFTREAQQLAKTNGVRLVDKKELQSLLLEHLKESWS